MKNFINIDGTLINLDNVTNITRNKDKDIVYVVFDALSEIEANDLALEGDNARRAYEYLCSLVPSEATFTDALVVEDEFIAALKRTHMNDGTFNVYASDDEDKYQFTREEHASYVHLEFVNADGDFRGVPYKNYKLSQAGMEYLAKHDPEYLIVYLEARAKYGTANEAQS